MVRFAFTSTLAASLLVLTAAASAHAQARPPSVAPAAAPSPARSAPPARAGVARGMIYDGNRDLDHTWSFDRSSRAMGVPRSEQKTIVITGGGAPLAKPIAGMSMKERRAALGPPAEGQQRNLRTYGALAPMPSDAKADLVSRVTGAAFPTKITTKSNLHFTEVTALRDEAGKPIDTGMGHLVIERGGKTYVYTSSTAVVRNAPAAKPYLYTNEYGTFVMTPDAKTHQLKATPVDPAPAK